MIRILRFELERVDRCLLALESLAGPKRGRPRKSPLPIGRRLSGRPVKAAGSAGPVAKAHRTAVGQ